MPPITLMLSGLLLILGMPQTLFAATINTNALQIPAAQYDSN
jgi:hypothetical protein